MGGFLLLFIWLAPNVTSSVRDKTVRAVSNHSRFKILSLVYGVVNQESRDVCIQAQQFFCTRPGASSDEVQTVQTNKQNESQLQIRRFNRWVGQLFLCAAGEELQQEDTGAASFNAR